MLATITECIVLIIMCFVVILFDTMIYRFLSHYTASYNPSTESSIGKFTSCFFLVVDSRQHSNAELLTYAYQFFHKMQVSQPCVARCL